MIRIPSRDGRPYFICAFSNLLIGLVILWILFPAVFVEQIQVFPETVSIRLLCELKSLWMLGIYAARKSLRLFGHLYPTFLCVCAWMDCLSLSGASSNLSCCGLGGGCGNEDWGGEKAFSLHTESRGKGRIPCLFYFKVTFKWKTTWEKCCFSTVLRWKDKNINHLRFFWSLHFKQKQIIFRIN